MLGVLLVLDLMAISLVVYLIRGQREFLREAVLIGFVLWGALLLAATEVLNLFSAIGFWEVLIFWAIVLTACLVIICKKWGSLNIRQLIAGDTDLNVLVNNNAWFFQERVFLNRIVFFSFCLGVIALFAPPNSYDAMSYHMSRVMHWIQDRNLMYYPTNISLQLFYPAFAEYVILHFQLLSGGDYWANAVQWLAMSGSLVAVSLIARELGAGRRGQILSALIAVTIPMGVLQATSTQTDYVDTLWLCTFLFFFLRWRKTLGRSYAILIGASLGLDLATKGVVMIYALPFLVWMLVEVVRRLNFRKICIDGGLALGVALLFYAGILYRITAYFHGQAAKMVSVNDSLINARLCWEGFLANLLRNTGLHLITPSWQTNVGIKDAIYKIASVMHVDLNNKDWSFFGAAFSTVDFRGIEEYLGNPLHLILFVTVTILFVGFARFRNRDAAIYLAACILGWIAFNLILKWQPYHSRFHLGLFVIFAPLAGFVIERIMVRWLVTGIMGMLFLSAWVIVLIDANKPIFNSMSIFYPQDRPFLHFIRAESAQSIYLAYEEIGIGLKKMGCKNIGLIMGQGDLEYLIWVALNPAADHAMRIESIYVSNASAALPYPLGDFSPDAIIAHDDDRQEINWGNNTYRVIWHNETVGKKISVLLKAPLAG
jgi:4-amino-4-deoxy-L-arabinose transferase-like glycosyltransferase